MGYRSQVKIVIYGEQEKLEGFIAGQKLAHPSQFSDWEAWGTEDEPTFSMHVFEAYDKTKIHIFLFQLDDVKWYTGYPHIDFWMDKMLPLAHEVGLDYEFVRVGEERDDIEVQESSEDGLTFLNVHTEITKDF